MSKAPGGIDQHVFQIDEMYDAYRDNKRACRKENINKYFCQERVQSGTIASVNRFIAQRLVQEHPGIFQLSSQGDAFTLQNNKTNEKLSWYADWQAISGTEYVSLFDALCSQVQEDLAVCQVEGESDYLGAIHLCAPNHWAPGDKIGKPFRAVHAPVPGMERTLQHYEKMLASVIHGHGPFTRFAWGIATDKRLNHHPEPPTGINPVEWYGRAPNKNDQWYVRTERQNLIGFPDVNAFLFTIRTYFYSIDELDGDEKKMLLSAVKSMSADALRYKGLSASVQLLSDKLSQ